MIHDPDLQKQVDELAEQVVDDWQEQKHTHEIVRKCECHQCTWLRANQFERAIIQQKAEPCCEFNRDGWRMNWRPGQIVQICESCLKNESRKTKF